MANVKSAFTNDIETIINKYKGVVSLPTLIYELNGKWALTNSDQTASLLELLGFGVTYIRNRYIIDR